MRRSATTTTRLFVTTVVLATVLAVASGSGVSGDPPPPSFTGLTPGRLVDTRPSGQTVDGLAKAQGPVGAGQTLTFPVLGRGGVPLTGVGTVALNVTAINPSVSSFLTVFPTGSSRPNASNLNLAPGRTLPNMVIVPLGTGGQVSMYNDQGSTNVAVDVLGWFPQFSSFAGLVPVRLADTRPTGQTVDGLATAQGPIDGGQVLSIPVAGRGGVPSDDVGAVALNVTAINPSAASFLTVFPAGSTRPDASNLNLAPARTLPNMVIVPLGAGGQVSIYNDQGSTNVAVDVLGWFPEGPGFTGLTPARLADTRPNGQTVDGLAKAQGALGPGQTIVVPTLPRGGIPGANVGAVVLNVTAINPSAASFVTVYPTGEERPLASNLNLAPGRTLPNLVIVPLGLDGDVTIYNDQGSTHIAVDVLGWFPSEFQPQSTSRVNLSSAGVQATTSSSGPRISGNGRYVTFRSSANNLVANDTNNAFDIFVHDRWTQQTTRVSVASNGTEANEDSTNPSISANGRFVAFSSLASNLVAGDTNSQRDVFVHDRWTGTTTRENLTSGGAQALGGSSNRTAISDDGRFVAFDSYATNLVAADTNSQEDIFVRDRQTGQTTRVSVATGGTQAEGGGSTEPTISADGRFVAFVSNATNLVALDLNLTKDIFVHDRQTGQTTRVSVATGGAEGNDASFFATISATGRYVAFDSVATNLVALDTNLQRDVFVHDRQTGQTTRVSVATGGIQSVGGGSTDAMISADGRYVTMTSGATNLVGSDTNSVNDIFVHDRSTGITTRVSVATAGTQATASSGSSSISADGRFVAFQSNATNLVTGDSNTVQDTFVRDRGTTS